MPRILVLAIATVLLEYFTESTIAGNTTCAGNMTQWYTDAVGETACMTYQRLRQICNPDYQVPNFRVNTPGDQCDDQLQSCCCNSISWALSMLCMNCQWDVDGGPVAGIDAGVGAYAMYRSPNGPFCTPGTNQSLPTDIQSAVCNKDIKLANFLYNLFWSDGAWFYVYTMDSGVEDEAATNNNMYTNCNSTTSSTTSIISITSSSSSQSTSTTLALSQTATVTSVGSTSNSKVPTIVGAIVGSAVVLVAAVIVGFCWRKRQWARLARPSLDTPDMAAISPYTLSGSAPETQTSFGFDYRRKRGHLPTQSDFSSSSPSTIALAATTNENSQGSSDFLRNADPFIGALRHEDAGAVLTLARSGSGRLPPAYNPGWEIPRGETLPLNAETYSEYREGDSRSHRSDRDSNTRRSKR